MPGEPEQGNRLLMLKIGNIPIPSRLVLAPMAGITDTCARRMARRFGAGLVFSEMVSSAGLVRRQPRTLQMLAFHSEEPPYGVQIFGAEPAEMAEAARIAEDAGASMVDVNMGCPVKRVCRTGAGAALLCQPKRVEEVLSAVRRAIQCPLTVKMRLGWDTSDLSVLSIARIAEEQGADAITLHPRTRAQGYQGKADWSWIARLKEERDIPVIGNGDLVSPQECREALQGGSCDGVMVGRAARGNPWIFSRTLDLLSAQESSEPSLESRFQTILLHKEWLCTQYGKEQGLRRIRFLLFQYGRGLPRAARFRQQLVSAHGEEALEGLLRAYFLDGADPTSVSPDT
jgi:nifR3 family TIM-barrel protein